MKSVKPRENASRTVPSPRPFFQVKLEHIAQATQSFSVGRPTFFRKVTVGTSNPVPQAQAKCEIGTKIPTTRQIPALPPSLLWSAKGQTADIQRSPGDNEEGNRIVSVSEPVEGAWTPPIPELPAPTISSNWLRGRSRQWLVDDHGELQSNLENIFELTVSDWSLRSVSGDEGTIGFRLSEAGSSWMLGRFEPYFQDAIRGRTLPEGEEISLDPRRILVDLVLPFITVAVQIANQPADPVVVPLGEDAEFTLDLEAQNISVSLLRAGGPVELRADIGLRNGAVLGSITRAFYVAPSSLEEARVQRVLQYRDLAEEISARRGMDPSIVMAIISMETQGIPGGRAGVETQSGYFGLMQARRIRIGGCETGTGSLGARDECYSTRTDFEAAIAAYRADISRQIEDGVTAFLGAVRALGFPAPATGLTDEQIELALASYGAGIGTLRSAQTRAAAEGGTWSEFRFLIPALARTGAYDVRHLFPIISRGWDAAQFRRRLQQCCGETASETDSAETMRGSMIACLSRQRRALMAGSDIPLEQLQSGQYACLSQVIERKARNTVPSRGYFRSWFAYRRFYQSLE